MRRRTFLKLGVAAIASAACPLQAMASIKNENHILSFYNIHTGESLKTCYRANGKLIERALMRINYILRDYRTGEIKPVDPSLLDLLHRMVVKISPHAPISIISGYRSPRTNAALRKITTGVARNSLHMQGRAIDIRIPGCRTKTLHQLAVGMKSGGAGYYPDSNFVHLDTGPIKVW
ncbi:MAG: Twin-arginine translocation pathway signal [Proteobacteria bacterium]|nr:MAG: Twin-arginine translocation pathway signal [Pseudomonadota bacterium]PIE68092.1 MAG: Twin-arginine translocation pathway signal [Deltaproteobacteria bacterium]